MELSLHKVFIMKINIDVKIFFSSSLGYCSTAIKRHHDRGNSDDRKLSFRGSVHNHDGRKQTGKAL